MELKNAPDQVVEIVEDDHQPSHIQPTMNSHDNILGRVGHEIFRYEHLDRKLERYHITGKLP